MGDIRIVQDLHACEFRTCKRPEQGRIAPGSLEGLFGGFQTALVWGESDQVLPVTHARAAASGIAPSRLEISPGRGHMPHVERPEAFRETVLTFLERPAPEASRSWTSCGSIPPSVPAAT
jgi:hypothetical protein